MMQGDSYKFPITITMNGESLTGVSDIEVMIGCIRKTMSAGDVEKDDTSDDYLVSVKQTETFKMHKQEEVKVRVLFNSGDVIGAYAGLLNVYSSLSKVVLKNG